MTEHERAALDVLDALDGLAPSAALRALAGLSGPGLRELAAGVAREAQRAPWARLVRAP